MLAPLFTEIGNINVLKDLQYEQHMFKKILITYGSRFVFFFYESSI